MLRTVMLYSTRNQHLPKQGLGISMGVAVHVYLDVHLYPQIHVYTYMYAHL